MERLAGSIVEISLAAVGITLAACIIGVVQSRLMRTDLATALYSAVPGGPVDMAVMAAQHGGDPVRTAMSQITRIALVVLLFPPLTTFSSSVLPPQATGEWMDSALLIVIGAASGLAVRALGLVNPFFLGPLIVVGVLSAIDVGIGAQHAGVVPMAQLLLGVSLGGMFRCSVFRNAGRFVVSTLITTGVLLGVCALIAESLSLATGADVPTMMLANAPGAVTEMVLTATVLQLDVPMVAGFQIARIVVCILFIGIFLRFARRVLG